MSRNIKTYNQYLSEKILMSDLINKEGPEIDVKNVYDIFYNKLFYNHLLMKDVVKGEGITESQSDVFMAIKRGDFEKDPVEFYDSFNKSKRVEFLTPYTMFEISKFNNYKLRGYNIGFSIKNNGDIVLVHNNEKISGIGKVLMEAAIDKGGTHLDHFDGFLTGFYKKCGFKLKGNDIFNDEYAPDGWKYEPIDISNPKKSIYAEELTVEEKEFIEADKRYSSGKVDIVYRKI